MGRRADKRQGRPGGEWCIPPKANAHFVYHMEDVLDVYKRPEDPRHPLFCFDEGPEQLVSETRQSLPAVPGQADLGIGSSAS